MLNFRSSASSLTSMMVFLRVGSSKLRGVTSFPVLSTIFIMFGSSCWLLWGAVLRRDLRPNRPLPRETLFEEGGFGVINDDIPRRNKEKKKGEEGETRRNKEKKKKKKGKKLKSVDVFADPVPPHVTSILLNSNAGDMTGEHTKPPKSKANNENVEFDEESIETTSSEMAFYRGASGRVDDLAWDCGYYMQDDFGKKKHAENKLRGAPVGMFVIYNDPDGNDALILTVVKKDSSISHFTITHSFEGLQLEGEGPFFKFLSKLVGFYSSENSLRPEVMRLSPIQRAIMDHAQKEEDDMCRRRSSSMDTYAKTKIRRQTGISLGSKLDIDDDEEEEEDDDEEEDEEGGDAEDVEVKGEEKVRQNEKMEKETVLQVNVSGVNQGVPLVGIEDAVDGGNSDNDDTETVSGSETSFASTALTGVSQTAEALQAEALKRMRHNKEELSQQIWYKGDMNRAEAVSMIEFEPSGTFVVRDNFDEEEDDHYIVTYVDDGDLKHCGIRPYGDGYAFIGENNFVFDSVLALIEGHATNKACLDGPLSTTLRLPRREAPPLPSSSHGAIRAPVGGGTERPVWLRTGMPKAEALAVIQDKGNGSFVVRTSESRKDSYVLSYKYKKHTYHELIKRSGSPPSFHLQHHPNINFPSLQDLVSHFSCPQMGLRTHLDPSVFANVSNSPKSLNLPTDTFNDKARRRSSRTKKKKKNSFVGKVNVNDDDDKDGESGPSTSRNKPPSPFLRQSSKTNGLVAPVPLQKRQSSVAFLTEVGRRQSAADCFSQSKSMRKSKRQSVRVAEHKSRLDQRATSAPWCCLDVSKDEALDRLSHIDGSFVVRRSDEYFATLSMFAQGKVHHFHIEDKEKGIKLKKSKKYQPNLSALIAFYKIPTQTHLPCALRSDAY
eukprot:m.192669 g.192669  ORF g.192669 m.192669 type:complete len:889 (-) comp13652_c2_seq18:125-2791(-)